MSQYDKLSVVELIDLYQASYKTLRKDRANTDMAARVQAMDNELARRLEIREVTRSDTHILRQLVNEDDVHEYGVRSVEEIQEFRVGGEGSQKTAFVLINPENDDVIAAIYGYKFTHNVNTGREIPGDIANILLEPCQQLQGQAKGIVFYSITGLKNKDGKFKLGGAGQRVIGGLLDMANDGAFPKGFTIATLSPLRTLANSIKRIPSFLLRSGTFVKALAIVHLMRQQNPVQSFHMRDNGAAVGDIKTGVGMPGGKDEVMGLGAMVNYVYNISARARKFNQVAFARGIVWPLLAPHLRAPYETMRIVKRRRVKAHRNQQRLAA